jgi:hypothetical protein
MRFTGGIPAGCGYPSPTRSISEQRQMENFGLISRWMQVWQDVDNCRSRYRGNLSQPTTMLRNQQIATGPKSTEENMALLSCLTI